MLATLIIIILVVVVVKLCGAFGSGGLTERFYAREYFISFVSTTARIKRKRRDEKKLFLSSSVSFCWFFRRAQPQAMVIRYNHEEQRNNARLKSDKS